MKVSELFIKYVKYDTKSARDTDKIPSTDTQFALAEEIVKDMKKIGIKDARMDEHCYVYGSIPANMEGCAKIGFIAHMDTSPDFSGKNVNPRIIKDYDGKDIVLSRGIKLSLKNFPQLKDNVGNSLIVTDGKTLLGADDKAGIAEILTMAERIIGDPSIKHGRIAIAFTPDEEVGSGADAFDLSEFDADFAYTVDGGELGELEYENFNAASLRVMINGSEIHPGTAKDKMLNAQQVAFEFNAMLPPWQRPEHTEGYDGFFHLCEMAGDVSRAQLGYIIRDHEMEKYTQKKRLAKEIAEILNLKYGKGTVRLSVKDSYLNMKEMILPHMHIIDNAVNAMKNCGVQPLVKPIRGGTDGARLSFMGLPCPNLCTGGYNFHGRYEFIPIEAMEKVTDILVEIVRLTSGG